LAFFDSKNVVVDGMDGTVPWFWTLSMTATVPPAAATVGAESIDTMRSGRCSNTAVHVTSALIVTTPSAQSGSPIQPLNLDELARPRRIRVDLADPPGVKRRLRGHRRERTGGRAASTRGAPLHDAAVCPARCRLSGKSRCDRAVAQEQPGCHTRTYRLSESFAVEPTLGVSSPHPHAWLARMNALADEIGLILAARAAASE
jgi:hypothetical protein